MKKILCISAVVFTAFSSYSFGGELTIEQFDEKLRMAYQEGVNESLKPKKLNSEKTMSLDKTEVLAAAAKTWVWCSDNKCSNRSEFSTYKGCYEYTKFHGGYCY